MKQSIVHVALVVKDYDEAIAFYTEKLHFIVIEDRYQPEQEKRWVVVSPPGSSGTALLLARASTYRKRIRKYIKEKSKDTEDLRDYQFELAVAYLLLSSYHAIHLEYEKYGGGPDFTVAFPQKSLQSRDKFVFNVEVKRIREHEKAKQFRKDMWDIRHTVQDILSPLELKFRFISRAVNPVDLSTSPNLVDRLAKEKDAIISYIKQTIHTEGHRIPLYTSKNYFFPGLEEDRFGFSLLKISRERLPDKPLPVASHLPGLWLSRGAYKVSDVIIQKELKQMREGEVNLLFLFTDSDVYNPGRLQTALYTLSEKVGEGDDEFFHRKEYEGTDEFLEKFKKVNGIILKNSRVYTLNLDEMLSHQPFEEQTRRPEHSIWYNPQSDQDIPQEICSYLQKVAQKDEIGFF